MDVGWSFREVVPLPASVVFLSIDPINLSPPPVSIPRGRKDCPMSKDVIIAGALAVGCVALIAAAFLLPKEKPTEGPAQTEVLSTESVAADPLALPMAPLGEAGTASFQTPGMPSSPSFPQSSGIAGSGASPFPSPTPAFGAAGTAPAFGAPVSGHEFGAALPVPAPVVDMPAAAPVASETRTHTVANGELLGDIALKYYGNSKSWKKIAAANAGVDPKHLKVGQKLVIPADDKAPASAASPVGSGERTYTVKSGDTYYSVAKRELGSAGRWKEIRSLNGKSGNDLRVGSVIKLPASGSSGSAAPVSGAVPTGNVHVVAKGETLADIARQHLGSSKQWKKIVEANPGVSPESLKIGQKLVIPGGESAAAVSGSSVPASGEYVVQPGDTPRTIAQKLLGSKNKASAIIDANPGINPNNLRVGQKLKIPGAPASVGQTPAVTPSFPAPTGSAFPTGPAAEFPPAGTAPAFPVTPVVPAAGSASPFQAAPSDFSSPYGAAPVNPAPAQPSPFAEPVR